MIKRIIFFIQNFGRPAGSERVTSIIASHLADNGYEVSILSICGNNTTYYPISGKVKLYTLIRQEDVNNRRSFLKVLSRLNQFYKKHPADLCIDVMPSLSIYTAILKRKHKLKNITWEHFNFKINTGMCFYGRKFAMRFSDKIITLTNTDKKYYCANPHIKPGVEYIYNPTPYPEARMHHFDNKQVITAGRLNQQKGFDRLIKVWALVEPMTDWNLKIFGTGEDYEELRKAICDAGLRRIELAGAVKNIDEQYINSSIYISTARYEGLPMTMIEAQSFGLPIISFAYDTGPADIISDGIDGFVIQAEDEQEMVKRTAEKLLEMTENDDLRVLMSKNAKKNAARFQTDAIMKKWYHILRELE